MNTLLPPPAEQAAQLREREEREISALASNCDPPNAVGWTTIECHECQGIETLKGSQRELAEYVYTLKRWMIYHGEPLCYSCQNDNGPVSDDDVRADEYYETLVNK